MKKQLASKLLFRLFGTEQPVSGITKPGNDIPMFIEMIVQSCDIDIDIRMVLLYSCYSFRSSDQIYESNMTAASLLDKSNSCAGTPSCCKHGIKDQKFATFTVGRKLTIILNRFQCLWITVQSYMSDPCGWNQICYSVNHSQPGS